MSYFYDPHINPTFDATRREIQRSIENLQDKLKKRRALQQQLVKQETEFKYRGIPMSGFSTVGAYPPASGLLSYLPLGKSQQQIVHEDYLNRINNLRLQREALDRKFDLQRLDKQRSISRFKGYQYDRFEKQDIGYRAQRASIQYDDEQLLKKYEDGTRARQYTNQLNDIVRDIQRQRSLQRIGDNFNYGKSARHIDNYENKLYQASRDNLASTIGVFDDKKYQTQQKNQLRTPYQKLKQNANNANSHNKSVKRNIYPQYDQNDKKYESSNIKDRKISFNNKQINQVLDKQEKTPRKYSTIDQQAYSPNQKYHSPYQTISGTKNSARKSIQKEKSMSRNKSNLQKSVLKKSILERSNQDRRDLQTTAMKKIQNRLKLSSVVYEDSKFKNIKHQLNHLFMTFDNQCKIRKDLKDKVNSNILVLKRYGMTVQG